MDFKYKWELGKLAQNICSGERYFQILCPGWCPHQAPRCCARVGVLTNPRQSGMNPHEISVLVNDIFKFIKFSKLGSNNILLKIKQ